MPSIKNQSTVRTTKQAAWVEAMLTGVTPTEAARIAKYADNTWKQRGHENVTNSDLMAEIDRRRAEIKQDTARSVASLDEMYDQTFRLAIADGQLSAAVSATTGIARLYGMDKQTSVIEKEVSTLSESETALAEQTARELKLKLA